MAKNKYCPKCGAKNPPILDKFTMGECNSWFEQRCMNIISYKKNWLGIIKPIYCESLNIDDDDFDGANIWLNKKPK